MSIKNELLAKPGFSFLYDGAEAALSCGEAKEGRVYQPDDALRITREVTYYEDFDAYYCVNWLENTSGRASGVVSSLFDCDITLPVGGDACIRTLRGISWSNEEFAEKKSRLLDGKELRYTAYDGVSSQGCFPPFSSKSGVEPGFEQGGTPFFNIGSQGGGYIFTIGWTGQWNAFFNREGDSVRIRSGLEDANFRLLPGEKIRTSSFLIFEYTTDPEQAQNIFRQLVLKHFSPKNIDTAPVTPLCIWGSIPSSAMLKKIEDFDSNALPYDYFWVDAGWYGCSKNPDEPEEEKSSWGVHTGEWYHNTLYHPDEMRSVAQKLGEKGKELVLWLQPELVHVSSHTYKEYRDFCFAHSKSTRNVLLDLGREEVFNHVYESTAKHIRKLGVKCYRQDFCCFPLSMWRLSDAPDRKGISEIKHIMGLYRFWDKLLSEFPDLVIDNCAGGGRRLDIEMFSRSIVLWSTDYAGNSNETQGCKSGLFKWTVSAGTNMGGNKKNYGDTYHARSCYGSSLGAGFWMSTYENIEQGDDVAWLKDVFAEYREFHRFVYKDFYLLTAQSASDDCWCVWQFHDPQSDEGVVVAFRRDDCPYPVFEGELRGIGAGTRYRFSGFNGEDSFDYCADCDGMLRLELNEKRSSCLLFYKKA